jgi:hypothetical protein
LTPYDYEIAFYAQTCWRLANSSDANELTAVAATIRNHVLPKLGQVATYESYTEACLGFLDTHPLRPYPSMQDEAFISRPYGLLYNIGQIYSGEMADITATHDHPSGARFFARVTSLGADDWRKLQIVDKPAIHCLLGTWGSMQFWS